MVEIMLTGGGRLVMYAADGEIQMYLRNAEGDCMIDFANPKYTEICITNYAERLQSLLDAAKGQQDYIKVKKLVDSGVKVREVLSLIEQGL